MTSFMLTVSRKRYEHTHSTRRLIRAGVPQGFTLSSLLYFAYTNDYRVRQQASFSHYSRTIPRFITMLGIRNPLSSTSRGPLMSWVDGSVPGGSRRTDRQTIGSPGAALSPAGWLTSGHGPFSCSTTRRPEYDSIRWN
ncbi:hypothetical protein EVAR_93516_1 [Eumeta japonica]|uniref:Reverse transcriptase domain-containing protein n=1 Tax=Eumeta variegata TaxID=151549 RepID=A0A4C1TMH4_EUMVA|nr:hypothetical protein EVAR_93516_1 [Eumeta japonica]